jgi:pimeloyl-ACP methyl ester carboxylesterase
MHQIELSAGPVEYLDTGGPGRCVVLVHGVLMNATVWRAVVADLRWDHRCIVPTLPLGAHRLAMRPDADLSITGLALLVAELLDWLDLRQVTLVMNDWGGPQLLVEQGRTDRIGGLALLGLLARSARVRRVALGSMAKDPIPDDLLTGWFTPLTHSPAVRRDLGRYIRSVPLRHRRDWSAGLARFTGRALVVWAPEDRLMPPEHGPRLAALLPDGHLVELHDSHTLIPLDQPARLAAHLRDFIGSR